MTKYLEEQSYGLNAVSLYYKGKTVTESDTPMSLGLENGDLLWVYKKLNSYTRFLYLKNSILNKYST